MSSLARTWRRRNERGGGDRWWRPRLLVDDKPGALNGCTCLWAHHERLKADVACPVHGGYDSAGGEAS